MFRISDILKRHKEPEGEKPATPAEKPAEAGSPKQETPFAQPQEPQGTQPSQQFSISSSLDKEAIKVSSIDVSKLYESALERAREMYKPKTSYEPAFLLGFSATVETFVDLLKENNKELLTYCVADFKNLEDYLYYHAVNVAIISIEIGIGVGYERSRLIELGIAGFVHDIGLVKYLDLAHKKEVLTKEEYEMLKQHPKAGYEILSKLGKGTIPPIVLEVVLKEHERLDGSGYPNGLKGNEVDEFAQIIGLADKYEAMIHDRPFRKKYSSLETVKEILSYKNEFDIRVIKTLIEHFGVFPLGTSVRLNTKEVGVVIKDNRRSPLRPTVNILYDAYGKPMKEPKTVDLSLNPVVYIEESLTTLTQENEQEKKGTHSSDS
ncbi:MAG: HD-GYP domain-containing protein [Candidatus Omnitrophota bacterium]|nr:MAG: HD-GYP domain-containing protein [Candidatus Omnitrophota bacterium]